MTLDKQRYPQFLDYAFSLPHTLADQLRALASKLDKDDKAHEQAWADTINPADYKPGDK
jgi:hypothetical protein